MEEKTASGGGRQRLAKHSFLHCASLMKENIAMAHVAVEYSAVDTELAVGLRDLPVKEKIVALPFYRKLKK